MVVAHPTPSQLEAQIARRLTGTRLVCERTWPEDLVREAWGLWAFQSSSRPGQFFDRYPGIGLLHLVHTGIRAYDDNTFWPATGLKSADQRQVGEAFERALLFFGLETFPQFRLPEEKARRFVSIILAHGGIPASMAGEFLRNALFPALRRGEAETGTDVVALWRRRPPTPFPKPVSRFLLNGGTTAVDLLDRLIDLAARPRAELERDPDSAGVPAHLVAAFLELPASEVPRAAVLPRPEVVLRWWDSANPILRIPAVGRELADDLRWEVDAGDGRFQAVGASRLHEREIDLAPAPAWIVRAIHGSRTRTFTYDVLGGNRIVCFAPDGRFLADAAGITADEVFVVAPVSVRLHAVYDTGTTPLDADLPESMADAWSGYRLGRFDLSATDLVAVVENGVEVERLPVRRPRDGVALVGHPVADVRSTDGSPVYADWPSLSLPAGAAWTVRLDGPRGGTSEMVAPANLRQVVELSGLADARGFGRYEVSARGPLGEDLPRTPFVRIPGLTIATPDRPLPPDHDGVDLALGAGPTVSLHDQRHVGVPAVLEIAAGSDRADVCVRSADNEKVWLLVSVPVVRWALRRPGQIPPLGSAVLDFEPAEIGREVDAIVIDVGRPDLPLKVGMVAGRELQFAIDRSGREGRAVFPLDRFRDTARDHAAQSLRLVLTSGDLSITLAAHHVAPVAQPARAAPEPPRAGIRPGDRVSGEVVAIGARKITLLGEGWKGTVELDRLPKPPADYQLGERVEARIWRSPAAGELMLDARPFLPERFPLHAEVDGRVIAVADHRLTVRVLEHDALVDRTRLPVHRPPDSWKIGQPIRARVLRVDPTAREIYLNALPFNPTGVASGTQIDAIVDGITPDRIFLKSDHGQCVVERANVAVLPHQGQSARVVVRAVEHSLERFDCWLGTFNATHVSADDVVLVEVVGHRDGGLLVRRAGGEPALIPRSEIPAGDLDRLETRYPVGRRIRVRTRPGRPAKGPEQFSLRGLAAGST